VHDCRDRVPIDVRLQSARFSITPAARDFERASRRSINGARLARGPSRGCGRGRDSHVGPGLDRTGKYQGFFLFHASAAWILLTNS